ncbi:MAG: CvpA family protein [Epsilonproteobacteria bacterium]|nr:MAG: CvpA family protein [Campylobacterota bacterium]
MDMSTFDFNYFDVTIATVVIILGIKGMINGFIKELFGLLGLVGGVYIASRNANAAATFIDKNLYHLENSTALQLLGFISILVIVWIIAIAVGSLFSSLTQASGLGFINLLLGFVIGSGKYFLIFALIVTALSNITLVKDNLGKYVNDSLLYPYLKEAGSYLINIKAKQFQYHESNSTVVLPASAKSTPDTILADENLSHTY